MKNSAIVLGFLLFVTFRIPNLNAQQTLELQPDSVNGKDAFLNELYPSTNFGKHPDFISYSWTFAGNEGIGTSLLQFELTGLPANASILDAKLFLYHNPATFSAGQASNNACYLRKVTDPWNESTVTWNSTPNTTTIGQIILAKSTLTNQDYPNINVTSFVQDWYLNPAANHGMFLELIDKSLYNSMKFCSSDCADSLKRPKLVIKYDVGVGVKDSGRSSSVFRVYPNPASDRLSIEFSEDLVGSYTIVDMMGRMCATRSSCPRNTLIQIDGWEQGVYFVKVESGTTVEIKKLILN